MEINKDRQERLKDIAIKATALVVGGAVVKYVWDKDTIKGYVYHVKETGMVLIGRLNGNDPEQFSGQLTKTGGEDTFSADENNLDEAAISELEHIFGVTDEQT